MKAKEQWYAVIGGCVGAVLTLVVCSFSPLGAQSQSDGNFGRITCTELEVVSPDGIFGKITCGDLSVVDYSDDGTEVVRIFASTRGGGSIVIVGGDGEIGMRNSAGMSIKAHDGGIGIDMYYRDDAGLARSVMEVSKNGGLILVHDNNGQAIMRSPRVKLK